MEEIAAKRRGIELKLDQAIFIYSILDSAKLGTRIDQLSTR